MWISTKPLNVKVWPRPARIAYLVPESPPHSLIDVLIDESLSRWGGRRTPIIPTDGKSIAPAYWSFLNLWDADIIYSYVVLSEELEDRIACLFAPSEIQFHEGMMESEDPQNLRPDYEGNCQFLSSLSLLPVFAKQAQTTGRGLPEIIDNETDVETERDVADSFGFLSNCSHWSQSLLPHARRISLCPKRPRETPQHLQQTVSYVEDAEQLVDMIARRLDILTLSRLSDMFCPHLHHLAHGRNGWDDHMTVVIGDDVADRLLFWNAQHRYSALGAMNDIPALRFSEKRFQNGIPGWFKGWINSRNRRHLHGNHAPRTVLRSCSLTKEQLEQMAAALGNRHRIMVSSEHHAHPCVVEGCDKFALENRRGLTAVFPSTWAHRREARQTTVRFSGSELDLPLTLPSHIKDVSPSGLTWGVWAVDLCIEREEDHCAFSNKHHDWKWPRRLRLEQTIGLENYGDPHSLVLPPRIRPTEYGDLTVWDSASWHRPRLHIPRDFTAFAFAVERFVPGSAEQKKAIESDAPPRRFEVTVSDKGRDLLGVLQFFQSLPEALAFLTDGFWGDVIRRLSPEELAKNEKSIAALAQKIRASTCTLDAEVLARTALELASRSLGSQRGLSKSATFEELKMWAYRIAGRDQGRDVKRRLTESVAYLRDRGFLWQGYGWRCFFCQHRNWAPLNRLSPILNCEICRTPQSSPVSGSLHFRLSPFAQHAFSSTSGQEAVVWCLDELLRRAAWSFAFVPAIDLYRPRQSAPETDIDLLAAIDGEIYVVEVKSSFAGVNAQVLDQLKRVAQELKPNVMMLAVMDKEENVGKAGEVTREFEAGLGIPDVRTELFTLDKTPTSSFRLPALPTDKQMQWAGW